MRLSFIKKIVYMFQGSPVIKKIYIEIKIELPFMQLYFIV